ncbi:MAG: hypothetical protein AAB770_00555 [Patescibacteria group bacterium]
MNKTRMLHLFKFRKKLPQIIIRYSKLLDPIFIFYCQNNPELKKGWGDWVPMSREKLDENIKLFRKEWKRDEEKILRGICNILRLDFYRNVIPVYIVSGNPRQLSEPLVIKGDYSNPARFVDTLIHELIHVILTDNGEKVPISIEEKMFPNESHVTQVHVIVYAVLRYIYLEVLNDKERFEKYISTTKSKDYIRALKIVEERGHRELIEQFIKMYK